MSSVTTTLETLQCGMPSYSMACSNKLVGKVFHIFEIDPCQLLRKLSKDLNVTGLSSLIALARTDKSVRQDDLLVAVVTN